MAGTPPSTQRRVTTLTDISSKFKPYFFERKVTTLALADGNVEAQGGGALHRSLRRNIDNRVHIQELPFNDYQPSKSPQPTFLFFAFRSSVASLAAGASRARFKYLPTPPPDSPLPMTGEGPFNVFGPTASPNQFSVPSKPAFLCSISEGARVVDASDLWASFFASLFLYSSNGS